MEWIERITIAPLVALSGWMRRGLTAVRELLVGQRRRDERLRRLGEQSNATRASSRGTT